MSKNLTPWFPPNVKPMRAGVYITDFRPYERTKGYSYWDGRKWGLQRSSAQQAHDYRVSTGHQEKRWRGLAEKP